MIKYPNGSKKVVVDSNAKNLLTNHANLGMTLEKDVEQSAKFFLDRDIAVFYKKPTPIKIFQVDTVNPALIKEAYFEKKSTTDYNGIYRGKYIDFECKETRTRNIPLTHLHDHQVKHLERVAKLGGIAFFLIRFTALDKTFILDISHVTKRIKDKDLKSFNYDYMKTHGILIDMAYTPRLDLTKALDEAYFKNEATKQEQIF